jgi:glutathione S-transferase
VSRPELWHIKVSHYSEKVRWALDWKGVEYDPHAPPPGPHMAAAMWVTRGEHKTFPVLKLDGRAIGDSTAIIAALEERYPEPALYPADPDARRRALELEDFFDEELGPHSRHVAFHYLGRDPEKLSEFAVSLMPAAVGRFGPTRRAAGAAAKSFSGMRYGVGSEESADRSRAKVHAAMDRLELELDAAGGSHLAGDSFSVADLTAAALFYPLVSPPEGPSVPEPSAEFAAFRDLFRERPGYNWVEETFARYRHPAP